MATIEERNNDDGSVSYRVKIRLKGRPQVSETFSRKTDARIWAQRTEAELRRGRSFGLRRTVAQAIDHYLKHDLPLLAESDRRNRVRQLNWWRERLGDRLLDEIGPADTREHLRSLTNHKIATVNRYRAALSAVFSAVIEEEWLDANPLHRARRRKRPNAEREEERDRDASLPSWTKVDRLPAAPTPATLVSPEAALSTARTLSSKTTIEAERKYGFR